MSLLLVAMPLLLVAIRKKACVLSSSIIIACESYGPMPKDGGWWEVLYVLVSISTVKCLTPATSYSYPHDLL